MSISALIEKGLIKKIRVYPEKIEGSIKLAERFLKKAEGNFKIGYWDIAFVLAYSSMFHTGRALLFKKGFAERSHYAMICALKLLYKENIEIKKFLEILNSYRIARHGIQYSGELCSKDDAEEVLRDAKEFLNLIKKLYFKR